MLFNFTAAGGHGITRGQRGNRLPRGPGEVGARGVRGQRHVRARGLRGQVQVGARGLRGQVQVGARGLRGQSVVRGRQRGRVRVRGWLALGQRIGGGQTRGLFETPADEDTLAAPVPIAGVNNNPTPGPSGYQAPLATPVNSVPSPNCVQAPRKRGRPRKQPSRTLIENSDSDNYEWDPLHHSVMAALSASHREPPIPQTIRQNAIGYISDEMFSDF